MSWTDFESWGFRGSIAVLAIVLWWCFRQGFAKLDQIVTEMVQLRQRISDDVSALKERLARIEGHLWPSNTKRD